MTKAPTRDPLVDVLVDRAYAFLQLYDRWISRRLGDGVTLARLKLLFLLNDHGPQKMAVLAKKAQIVPRTLTTFIDALESEGLARRRPHETDRRAIIIEITPAGVKAVGSKSAPYWAAKNFLYEGLSQEEAAMMLRIYDHWFAKVAEDLARMGDAPSDGRGKKAGKSKERGRRDPAPRPRLRARRPRGDTQQASEDA